MKRPYLVHFLSVMTEESISIRASLALTDNPLMKNQNDLSALKPKLPIDAYRLLATEQFTVLIVGLDQQHNEIFRKHFDSDSFGNISFKIPLTTEKKQTHVLQIYEISHCPGIELILGSYIPLKVEVPRKLVISDFDKTLVHTRYSKPRELYDSLTKPITSFPTINKSLEVISEYIDQGFHPFILSASPHFYEDAMRDWLYQNKIFTAGIFLKDYRHIISYFEGDLSPKDIKTQGLYKLGHLLDILVMTDIPDQLVLMGDNYESDPLIYLALAKLLKEELGPWEIWNLLMKEDIFRPGHKQKSQTLNKIYQVSNMLSRMKSRGKKEIDLKIWIRKRDPEDSLDVGEAFHGQIHLVELYDAPIAAITPPKTISEEQKKEYNQ